MGSISSHYDVPQEAQAELEINYFLQVASTCYLILKLVGKFTYPVANTGGPFSTHCSLSDLTQNGSIW